MVVVAVVLAIIGLTWLGNRVDELRDARLEQRSPYIKTIFTGSEMDDMDDWLNVADRHGYTIQSERRTGWDGGGFVIIAELK